MHPNDFVDFQKDSSDNFSMLRKPALLIIGAIFIFTSLFFGEPAAFAKKKNPAKDPANPYAYASEDLLSIHFFPVERARWNGYKVLAKDWHYLTDFLKVRFLQDARTEIEVHENAVIQGPDLLRTLVAMNETVKMLEQDPKLKEMPVMKYYYVMLQQNNSIRKAASLVKLSKAKP